MHIYYILKISYGNFKEHAMLLTIENLNCPLLEIIQRLFGASFIEVIKLEPQVYNFHTGNQYIIVDLIKNKSNKIFNILKTTKLKERI